MNFSMAQKGTKVPEMGLAPEVFSYYINGIRSTEEGPRFTPYTRGPIYDD